MSVKFAIVKTITEEHGNISRYWMQHHVKGNYRWAGTENKFLFVKWKSAYSILCKLRQSNSRPNVTYNILDYVV